MKSWPHGLYLHVNEADVVVDEAAREPDRHAVGDAGPVRVEGDAAEGRSGDLALEVARRSDEVRRGARRVAEHVELARA